MRGSRAERPRYSNTSPSHFPVYALGFVLLRKELGTATPMVCFHQALQKQPGKLRKGQGNDTEGKNAGHTCGNGGNGGGLCAARIPFPLDRVHYPRLRVGVAYYLFCPGCEKFGVTISTESQQKDATE